jgi:HAD superfamily hydrolase (TIGR01549 family)
MRASSAILFDIDGTLIDSVDLHARAWQEALASVGIEVDFRAIRAQIGKGGDQLLPVFLEPRQLEALQARLESTREEVFQRVYLPRVHAFRRVRELFVRLRKDGIAIGLASSSKQAEVAAYRRIARIDDLVDAVTTADDVDRSKPFPDVFEVLLRRLRVDPDSALVVGDTPYDAIAAQHAGLRTVGVLCGGFPEEDLLEAGCVALFRNPADLLDRYGELRALLAELVRQPASVR